MKRERLVTSSRRAISALKQAVNKHGETCQQSHNNQCSPSSLPVGKTSRFIFYISPCLLKTLERKWNWTGVKTCNTPVSNFVLPLCSCSYLGQSSLAVMFLEADRLGIRMDSPGFLRILEAFSLTRCSIESKSGLSGGSGFGGPSSAGSSGSLTSWSSSSSSVSSCAWPFFFFFLFFFLAFYKRWTQDVCV